MSGIHPPGCPTYRCCRLLVVLLSCKAQLCSGNNCEGNVVESSSALPCPSLVLSSWRGASILSPRSVSRAGTLANITAQRSAAHPLCPQPRLFTVYASLESYLSRAIARGCNSCLQYSCPTAYSILHHPPT
ncbi:hypothetical protein IQ07DRAFT_62808 [Pyrenochaeta sp. DS3sAY3a]|nr:hypothetical protein IQ07DRAFT_62808 [Pyrenochaeta sp. DS3sAY3a]